MDHHAVIRACTLDIRQPESIPTSALEGFKLPSLKSALTTRLQVAMDWGGVYNIVIEVKSLCRRDLKIQSDYNSLD